jgi:hypothetical protein
MVCSFNIGVAAASVRAFECEESKGRRAELKVKGTSRTGEAQFPPTRKLFANNSQLVMWLSASAI